MFIFNTATTANGFLADPNNSLEWLFQVKSEAPDMGLFAAERVAAGRGPGASVPG